MELQIINTQGKDTGKKVNISDNVFNYEPNDHAIYLDVKQHLANKRQGTHKSKERAEISGSTRKLKKQKGTGTARAGSIKSPVFRGGGRVFGPKPRDYSFKLNKKLKEVARKSALTYKVKEGKLTILDSISFEKPSTKDYLVFLGNLSVTGKKTLLVLPSNDEKVFLSSRNIQNASVTTADLVSTYDIVNADTIIALEEAVKLIDKSLN